MPGDVTVALLPPTSELSRDSDLWFPDGNIVVIAEGACFRVHQGVLARHSVVFKDMFGVPQPAAHPTNLIDDCPVVHISERAEDFKHLLYMLYDGFR
ncbi:hypothetical protein L227DRAFT_555467 [Lentinus tigrinus ALCF2SS1-6]|uniref:BTB domain-containing protein n=1 Tax=Lentinus tigrinus ALCF2SS1-6 TaxID=1328759 RepID=A0A5C2RVK4_9APHY|nr:hypothetical protein L227DRAFT_555467 [Lentinus tigrinus ALCF2SS1-6]